jgi:hypothetical protein
VGAETIVAVVAALGVGFIAGMLAMARRLARPPRRCLRCGVMLPAQCAPGTGCTAPTARHRIRSQQTPGRSATSPGPTAAPR